MGFQHIADSQRIRGQGEFKPGAQPFFCKASKTSLSMQEAVKAKLQDIVMQGILERVQPGGVTNASLVVWQRKKNGDLRLWADYNVHINGKVMDEDYPLSNMETIFHNLCGANSLEKLMSQTLTIKLHLMMRQNKCAQSTPNRGCSRCVYFLKVWKLFLDLLNCIENTLKEIKALVIFQDDLLVYGTSRGQYKGVWGQLLDDLEKKFHYQ